MVCSSPRRRTQQALHVGCSAHHRRQGGGTQRDGRSRLTGTLCALGGAAPRPTAPPAAAASAAAGARCAPGPAAASQQPGRWDSWQVLLRRVVCCAATCATTAAGTRRARCAGCRCRRRCRSAGGRLERSRPLGPSRCGRQAPRRHPARGAPPAPALPSAARVARGRRRWHHARRAPPRRLHAQ